VYIYKVIIIKFFVLYRSNLKKNILKLQKNHVISKWIHYDTITQRQLNVLIIEKLEDGTNAETCSLMFNKKIY
jgi:hypothetical protein